MNLPSALIVVSMPWPALALCCIGCFLFGAWISINITWSGNKANQDLAAAVREATATEIQAIPDSDDVQIPVMDEHDLLIGERTVKVTPVMFMDGFIKTAKELRGEGLSFTIDDNGRIVHIFRTGQSYVSSAEEWFGLSHGVRIS